MAVETCCQNSSTAMSPRISFSHLPKMDTIPVEQYTRSISSPGVDFEFCVVSETLDDQDQSSSADELFFNGKILPIDIKKSVPSQKKLKPQFLADSGETKTEAPELSEEKQNTKSYWGFKRSSSLNHGNGYGRSLCPLPLLSRSHSTGSATKRSMISKNTSNSSSKKHHNSEKLLSSVGSMKQLSQSSSSSTSHQKPPLKKNCGNSNGINGVKFTPVINVPSASLFGLGSIFSNGKEKNKKKVIH